MVYAVVNGGSTYAQINTGSTGRPDSMEKVLQHKSRIDICKHFCHDAPTFMTSADQSRISKSTYVDHQCTIVALCCWLFVFPHTMPPVDEKHLIIKQGYNHHCHTNPIHAISPPLPLHRGYTFSSDRLVILAAYIATFLL